MFFNKCFDSNSLVRNLPVSFSMVFISVIISKQQCCRNFKVTLRYVLYAYHKVRFNAARQNKARLHSKLCALNAACVEWRMITALSLHTAQTISQPNLMWHEGQGVTLHAHAHAHALSCQLVQSVNSRPRTSRPAQHAVDHAPSSPKIQRLIV